jgi:flagellar L-ring protein precursor FlgH
MLCGFHRLPKIAALALLGLAAVLTGCASAPATNVQQPMSARPVYKAPENIAANGSIFQGNGGRSIFEDRRARYIGDTVTINVVEKNTASTKSNTKTARDSTMTAGVNAYAGLPGKNLIPAIGLGLDSKNEFDGSGESKGENTFTSTITATVVDVLPNGNLIVSGEKQVAINQGSEFIRFSGVVNPSTITTSNAVNSSQIADARIEYKQNGYLVENQQPGWLARFFLNVMPF